MYIYIYIQREREIDIDIDIPKGSFIEQKTEMQSFYTIVYYLFVFDLETGMIIRSLAVSFFNKV